MRPGLTVALVVVAGGIAGALIGNNILAAAPAEFADPPRATSLSASRDYISPSELDPAVKSGLLPPGVRSLLKTDARMQHGEYIWDEAGAPPGKLLIWVDLRTQLVSVFRGGHEIGTAVVVYGAETMKSPVGRFPILSKHRDYHSRSYDAPMPYSLFITRDGVALHGSPMSRRRATHGCIGLPDKFAALLFNAAKVGDEVRVTRSPSTTPQTAKSAPGS